MRSFSIGLAFLCGVLASGLLMAGTTNELDALKTGYAAEKARIDNAYEQQKPNALAAYRKSVDAQMAAVKQKGDLDGYLALETEKKRLAAQNTINTNDIPALAELVAQYHKTLQEATCAHDKANLNLLRQYVGRLTTLMQNFTRADRLDEAKTVRNELQGVKTELTFLEADAPAEAPKATPPPTPTTTPTPPPPVVDNPTNAVAGTWEVTWRNAGRVGTETDILSPDGTVACPRNGASGTWEVKGNQCLIRWPTTLYTLTVSPGGKHMMGHNRQGSALSAVKTGGS